MCVCLYLTWIAATLIALYGTSVTRGQAHNDTRTTLTSCLFTTTSHGAATYKHRSSRLSLQPSPHLTNFHQEKMLSWNRDGSNSSNNARPVASNIQAYVNGATLPPILYSIDAPKRPPEGHKSHKNSLAIRPEQYRKLRRMDRVDAEVINNQVLACMYLCPIVPITYSAHVK